MTGTAAICRVAVHCGARRADISLPADMPLEVFMADVLDILGHAESTARWQLSPVGRAPLDPRRSLRENDVDDGTLLLLTSTDVTLEPPRFDDVTDAVLAGVNDAPRWTTRARQVGGTAVAVFWCLLAAVALAHDGLGSGGPLALVVSATAGVAALTAAAVAARKSAGSGVSTPLTLCAIAFGATAGLLAVPGDDLAPRIVLATAVATTASVLGLRIGHANSPVMVAIATCGGCVSVAFVGGLLCRRWPPPTVGALLTVAGLASMLVAARMAIAAAGVPLPDVSGAAAGPADAGLRARRAAHALTGLLCGLTATTVLGSAIAAAHPGGLALAALTAVILLLRSRFHVDRVHVSALVAGGALCLAAVFGNAVAAWPAAAGWLGIIAIAAAALALLLGRVAAPTTPSVRRGADIAEYLALAAVIPVACWACGVYGAVRGMRLS